MSTTELDAHCALIVVDLQVFARRLPYAHPIEQVAHHAGDLAGAFRTAGLTVVLTEVAGLEMGHADRSMQASASLGPAELALMGELDPTDVDLRIPKKHWGAFTGTPLAEELHARSVTQVVLAGVATGFGVESTARCASELGFSVMIAQDAMTDMDAQVHERAVERIFPAMAQVRSTEQILQTLRARAGRGDASPV